MPVPPYNPERENPLGLPRQVWTWHSPHLQREMSVCRWGFYGEPVLLFPTAGGDFLECERFLMVKVLSPLIAAGRMKLYACGSISADGWMNHEVHPGHRSWMQELFDRYLAQELLPFIQAECGGYKPFFAAGASLGAYNAANAACRHPSWFSQVVAMSGTFDFDKWQTKWRGYDPATDRTYHHHQPLRLLPGLQGGLRDGIRGVNFLVATGQGRWEEPAQSVRLVDALQAQGVPATLDLWGTDVDHDWPTWRTMLPLFLDRLLPGGRAS
jgi:esterase/lipase superfamily enzyme